MKIEKGTDDCISNSFNQGTSDCIHNGFETGMGDGVSNGSFNDNDTQGG